MHELFSFIRALMFGGLFIPVESDHQHSSVRQSGPPSGVMENDPRGSDRGEITDSGPIWQ